MRTVILAALLSVISWGAMSQNFHLSVFGGMSNYQGDLQDKKFTFQQSHFAGGIGAMYELSDKLNVRAGFTYGKVSADDKNTKKYIERNLNFTSEIKDFHLGLEYDLLNLYEHSITPYVFAGAAYFMFNPYTYDANGTKVNLQPLGTEGQGFYQGRQKYALSQFSVPVGGGIKFALNDNIRISYEIGLRKLFTDYLDDVSRDYVDESLLLANNGPKAVEMAFRGGELKTGLMYPVAGSFTIRGNPKSKDWYYFSGLRVSFRLVGKEDNSRFGNRKTGCPASFY